MHVSEIIKGFIFYFSCVQEWDNYAHCPSSVQYVSGLLFVYIQLYSNMFFPDFMIMSWLQGVSKNNLSSKYLKKRSRARYYINARCAFFGRVTIITHYNEQ